MHTKSWLGRVGQLRQTGDDDDGDDDDADSDQHALVCPHHKQPD